MKHLNLVSRIFLLSIIILTSSFYANAQTTVTIINNTSAVMQVSYTVIVPGTCADATGGTGDANTSMVGPGGSLIFPKHPSEVIDQVVSEPDPWCNTAQHIGGGAAGNPACKNAYLTGNGGCGTGTDRCGCSIPQYANPYTGQTCTGNPLNWCNSVVGNTIYIN